jgi:hypothetical protein
MVERSPCKREVVGSSPTLGSMIVAKDVMFVASYNGRITQHVQHVWMIEYYANKDAILISKNQPMESFRPPQNWTVA